MAARRVTDRDALRLIHELIDRKPMPADDHPSRALLACVGAIASPESRPAPEDDATIEICLCAALWFEEQGRIVRGHRHGDCFLAASSIKAIVDPRAGIQGFLTTRNRFVDRAEGFRLQIAAGIQSADRMGYRAGKLYSEDLY